MERGLKLIDELLQLFRIFCKDTDALFNALAP
jgi:hypothetical protein